MILIPVKNLQNAKQRLAPVLTPAERSQFARAMLKDVLHTMARCRFRDRVAVVTGDAYAQVLARQLSFEVIDDPANPGETGAIEMATRICAAHGADFTLVLPGDIPLITTAEVESIFAANGAAGTVLVPSASGRGTNAALRRPADLFPLRFGDDSFLPHLAAARATGKPVQIVKLPGIGLDVDDAADLCDLLARPGRTCAQQLLREWRVGARLATSAAR